MLDTVSRRRTLRSRVMIAIATMGIVLLVFPLRHALGFIQRPFVVAGTWIARHSFGLFEPGAASSARVARLEEERMALAIDRMACEQMKTENQDLRERLSFAKRGGYEVVSADIIARTVGVQTSSFSINRGQSDGLRIGMPALVGNGILAGKVIEVTQTSATVAAITDRGTAVAASLLNQARTIGIISGLDGILAALGYIPKDQTVRVNDLVITSGLEDLIPSGLLIGIVNAVESKDTEPFERAIVEPLADIRRISSVSIIIRRIP